MATNLIGIKNKRETLMKNFGNFIFKIINMVETYK